MRKLEIKQLDGQLIHRANSNSFNGNRGDLSAASYKSYIEEVLGWKIPDSRKQKILDEIHKRFSKRLEYEAQHVSVMVAGPARYNAKRLDKSDQILQLSHDFCEWFDDLKKQIENSRKEDSKEEKAKDILKSIKRYMELGLDPTKEIMCLATIDNQKFIELYEQLQPKYKWRKNSNIFKLYVASLNGEVKETKKEVIFEDENFTAYIEGDRAYIKFIMKCKQQLIYALKKKGWWWNTHKGAWSTYLDRVDKEWIGNISEKYSEYL